MRERQEMALCQKIAQLSRCKKRKVGVVLYDREGKILSMGFNYGECTFNQDCFQHQLGLKCNAMHGETHAISNALRDQVEGAIGRAYEARITLSPCINCVKALEKVGVKVIKYIEQHKTFEEANQWAKEHGLQLLQQQ